ncbi:DNA/RNA helicase domain-containing protein [Actinomadura citrea]|uniref:DNA/RNA helicase domain-containing protein n=1 Tax=Actinomadura citrea TaxID=46158 RepID=UPI003CE53E11
MPGIFWMPSSQLVFGGSMPMSSQPAYRASAENLHRALNSPGSAAEKAFIDKIATALKAQTKRAAGAAQRRAWRNSLTALANDLLDVGLGQVEMIVEYPMPHHPQSQADVVLAGVDPYTGGDAFVVVELKQWQTVEFYENDEAQVVWNPRYGPKEHPALQVEGYRNQIRSFCSTVKQDDTVSAMVYLHNMSKQDAGKLVGLADERDVGLFTFSERGELQRYLKGQFGPTPGVHAADRLISSQIKPRRELVEQARLALKGRDGFILLDRQIEAYRAVFHAVDEAFKANSKRVVIISGGPGSGKSAIALELLARLLENDRRVRHATGSSAFTNTLRARVAKGRDRAKLFTFSMDYAQAEPNELDVLIVDEAHRARNKTRFRWDRTKNSDRPQIETMIDAARVPVFFLDENQAVAHGELGSISAIKSHAQHLAIPFQHVTLTGQWRCGGSAEYDLWVRRLLGLGDEEGAWDQDARPVPWSDDSGFTIRLARSPAQMENFLRARQKEGWTARITAGFCWEWSPIRGDRSLVPDVRIGDWERPWNVKSTSRVGDAPPKQLWATADGGFDQIGCIYTAQGLEFDWAGVLIGPDLVARNGRLTPERSGNLDPELGLKSPRILSEEEFSRFVRNIYKVLLTRGLHGIVLYATDPATHELLETLVPPLE